MTRGKHIWLVPLFLALLVGGVGWWADRQLRQAIQQELRADLQSTLDANVTALEIWMENQKRIAAGLAEEPRFQAVALELFERSAAGIGAKTGEAVGRQRRHDLAEGVSRVALVSGQQPARAPDGLRDVLDEARGLRPIARVNRTQTCKIARVFRRCVSGRPAGSALARAAVVDAVQMRGGERTLLGSFRFSGSRLKCWSHVMPSTVMPSPVPLDGQMRIFDGGNRVTLNRGGGTRRPPRNDPAFQCL